MFYFSLRLPASTLISLCLATCIGTAIAANPGLPLSEDFTSTNLADAPKTTARWDGGGLARMQDRNAEYGPFRFLPGQPAAVFMPCYDVEVGDLDGNGAPDVVLGCAGLPPRLFLNNGTATPWSGTPDTGLSIGPDTNTFFRIALGDVDADGDLDVMAVDTNYAYWIFHNNGTTNPFLGVEGTLTLTNLSEITAYEIALADVDRDGLVDLLVGHVPVGQGHLRYFQNTGGSNPWLSAEGVVLDSYAPSHIAVADANHDGHLDVFAAHPSGMGLRLYTNNGTSTPWTNVTPVQISTDWARSLAVGDVTGDGHVDVIVAVNTVGMDHRLYTNNGTATPFAGVTGSVVGTYGFFILRDSVLVDLDADGDLDLLSADSGSFGTLMVYENNGTPDPWRNTQGYNLDLPTSYAPIKIGVGDFNSDGKPDLLGVSQTRTNMYFYNMGSGNPWQGLFYALSFQGLSQRATALVSADFDRDGDVDLVSTHNGADGYGPTKLYYNNGGVEPWGTLIPEGLNGGTPNARAAVAGDVDGDGWTDLILGNYGETNLLYLNNGTAAPFSGVDPLGIGTATNRTTALVLADVDGDGWLDLVEGNDDQRSRVYLNRGGGLLWTDVAGVDVGTNVCATRSLAVADVNQNGKLDLIAGNYNQPARLFLNNGTTNPWQNVTGTVVSADAFQTVSLAVADVNGDGYPDIVAGNQGQPNRLYLNNRTANPWLGVAGTNITSATNLTTALQLCDVNRDGRLDLVEVADNGRPAIYINNGTAQPWAGVEPSYNGSSARYSTVLCRDFNGDGAVDMVLGRFNDHLTAHNGRDFKTYWNSVTNVALLDSMPYDTRGLVLEDVDGDGDSDLILVASSTNSSLFLNNGTTAPWAGVIPLPLATNTFGPYGAAVGDMNGDGRPDLLLAYYNAIAPQAYFNNGTTNPWAGVVPVSLEDIPRASFCVRLTDMNGDGRLDCVLGNEGEPPQLFINNGTANPWAGVSPVAIGTNTWDLRDFQVADVNGDGKPDVVTCNASGPICLYTNNGTVNPFAGVAVTNITSEALGWSSLDLGDADRDGDLDLVAADRAGMNYYFQNQGGDTLWAGVSGTVIALESNGTTRIRLYDINRDGKLEVVCANERMPNITISTNKGTASPWSGGASDFAFGFGEELVYRMMALGDVDRDGAPEIVTAAQNRPVRYCEPTLYNTCRGRALSGQVNSGPDSVQNVRLNALASTPPNTDIRYYLSNNGGIQWHAVRNNTNFAFPSAGNDLRWRAEFSSLSPKISPVLHSLSIVDLVGKVTYTVSSRYGMPVPAVGTHTCTVGSVVSFSVDPAVTLGQTQYACVGWTATANEPASGTSNSFSMTMNNPAAVSWHWATNYWLGLATNGPGTILASTSGWVRAYASAQLTATANPGYRFLNWTGDDLDGSDTYSPIGLMVYMPRTITANFIPENWSFIRASEQGNDDVHTLNPTNAIFENGTLAYMTIQAPLYEEQDESNRFALVGWQVDMDGDVVSGTGTAAVFTVTADGILNWNWERQYAISISAGSHGTMTGATNGWFNELASFPVVAFPDPYYYFYHWDGLSGPGSWRQSNTFGAGQAYTAVAAFRPHLTSNNIPHWWLAGNGLGTNYEDTLTDFDHDGLSAGEEYWTGTEPTNAASVLRITANQIRQGSNVVSWLSTTNGALSLPYQLEYTTNLWGGEWIRVGADLARTPPTNSWSVPHTHQDARIFYRVGVTN